MAELDRWRSLRRRAEERLFSPRDLEVLSAEEVSALVHELDVHQAELEIQNEELRNLTLELEVARDRFRDLFDFAPAGYLSLHGDGAILEANLKASELLGCERAKLLGQRVQAFIDPASQDPFYLHQQAVLESGRARCCELRIVKEDGSPRDVAIESVRIGDTERQTRVSLVDISARVAAEAALRDAKAQLERAVVSRTAELEGSRYLNDKISEAAPLLLWIFDRETRSTCYTNTFARELLGYRSHDELAAVAIDEIVDPLDRQRVRNAVRQLDREAGGAVVAVTFRARTRGGSPRWLSSRLVAFERGPDGGLTQVLGASTDITDLRLAEERALQLRHEAALAREREQREIAALLHDSIGQLLPLANTKLALLGRASDEATRVQLAEIEALISESHTTATSLTYRLSPPVIHEIGLASGLQSLVRDMRRDYALRVVVENETAGFALSAALEFAVYRVVHELLVNVAKHAGVKEALVRVTRAGSRLLVIVEDHGVGFVSDATRAQGFGLSRAGERLAYLGGRMLVRSEPDRGTRIELRVPLLDSGSEFEVNS